MRRSTRRPVKVRSSPPRSGLVQCWWLQSPTIVDLNRQSPTASDRAQQRTMPTAHEAKTPPYPGALPLTPWSQIIANAILRRCRADRLTTRRESLAFRHDPLAAQFTYEL